MSSITTICLSLVILLFQLLLCSAIAQPVPSPTAWPASAVPISRLLSFVARQYSIVYRQWLDAPTDYPNYGVPSESKWRTLSANQSTFTNGFFPGRFYYLVR